MRVFYSLLLSPAVCLAQASAPLISFNKTHHDFGRVLQGDKVSCKYEVTNRGNAPLQIKEVRPSCGCSYTMLGQKRLKPGETTFIEVRFESAGMIGSIHKSLNVVSDDPSNPNSTLTFEAGVTREIMPSATTVVFSQLSRNSSASSAIRLQSGADKPVAVTDVSVSNAPYLTCDIQKEGNDVILNMNIDGQLIPKNSSSGVDIITVRTNSRKIPILKFNIQWDTPLPIIASHNRIIWTGAPGKEYRTTVTLKHTDGKPFKIMDAISTSPLVKIIGLDKDYAIQHTFDVVLSTDTQAGSYQELLTFKLNEPEQKELEITIATALR